MNLIRIRKTYWGIVGWHRRGLLPDEPIYGWVELE
jgi:hypothetical protein